MTQLRKAVLTGCLLFYDKLGLKFETYNHWMKLEHQFPSAYTCSADLVLRDPDIQSVKAANAAAVSSIGC